ncbi:hypothetical protein COT27_00605 [Candidatus Kuenenbacteria bacterium CG08_land_8_20_14_0_20_37_23]|uniref:Uncharacterized protein n=1 Tax=Candidatus Kuenenbacteria bacterium CG08_land_8_20_14_0_20_37_23 TaxID=1974617 RepID=A0A2M6XTJ9_9BACT|nr:MAG: hypothetical protein COT27_00605 [Candidatus Kuenenbacteria bacterium CG08_land_8_20_14_0_20_37_23]
MAENQKIKIIDETLMQNLRAALADTLFFDDWQTAYRFVRKFEPPLMSRSPQIPEQFRDELHSFIVQAKWAALPALAEQEIVDLFQHHFMAQFALPGKYYDIWDKLRAKLITIPFYDKRDELRQKVRHCLLNNMEAIATKGPLDQLGKESSPTIKNWLVDYNKSTGGEVVDATKLNEYIVRHTVISKITEEEKSRLKKLFNFYEIAKISSLDPRGYEETLSVDDEKWGPGIIQAGRFIPTDRGEVEEMGAFIKKLEAVGAIGKKLEERIKRGEISGAQSMAQTLTAPSIAHISAAESFRAADLQNSIENHLPQRFQDFLETALIKKSFQQDESLRRQVGNDLKSIKNRFYHAINNKLPNEALGALFAIAENGQLRQMFEHDERFVKFWGEYLEKNNLDVEHFKNDPAEQKYAAMFLQYILVNRLKMKPQEAAMIGVVVGGLARQAGELEYQTIAYGDEETGEFQWNFKV